MRLCDKCKSELPLNTACGCCYCPACNHFHSCFGSYIYGTGTIQIYDSGWLERRHHNAPKDERGFPIPYSD